MYLARLTNPAEPEHWLRGVRRFTVTDEVNPTTRRASTVVKVYYRSWWSFRRTHRFVSEERIPYASVEAYSRPREAQELIEKLKDATGNTESMTHGKAWRSKMLRS